MWFNELISKIMMYAIHLDYLMYNEKCHNSTTIVSKLVSKN